MLLIIIWYFFHNYFWPRPLPRLRLFNITAIMPLTAIINYVFAFIFAVLSPISVIGQGWLVNNHGHTHI